MKPLSRRHLLRGAAGLALGLPFLDAMLPGGVIRSANADLAKPPRRVVFLMTPDGIEIDRWKLDIDGSEAKLSPSLVQDSTISEFGKPDNDILDKCLFVKGVPMRSAMDDRSHAQGHPGGTTAVFTGAFAGTGDNYGGAPDKKAGPPEYESIDQMIAGQIGDQTRFPAIYAGVRTLDSTIARRCFYAKGKTMVTPETSPYKLLETVFEDLDPSKLEQAKQIAAERTFVLDAIQGEYKSLRCRLGGGDRERVDSHLAHVEDLLSRLDEAAGGLSCELPSIQDELDKGSFSQAPDLTKAMFDLVAMAFACDLTRVVGFQLHSPDADGGGVYSWLGHDTEMHTISHLLGDSPEDKLEQADRWRAQQIMYLVSKLQSMKEADGSSVFDNTTILWTSEVGRGWNHDYADPAWNIIGDGQGYFDTGRYVELPGGESSRHNLLLNHYLAYFGLDPSSGVGHPDYAKGGVLPGLAI